MNLRTLASLIGLLTLLSGCSAIPKGQAPRALPDLTPVDTQLRLVLLPPEIEVATEDRHKGYEANEVFPPGRLAPQLASWLSASESYTRVRSTRQEGQAAHAEAWESHDDLFVELRVRFKTEFDGHNGYWIPNILNWLFWIVPAWFVAAEDYSMSAECEVDLRALGSRKVVYSSSVSVRVAGSFDEFDRGWQPFGFIYPLNDADNWRQIAGKLTPALVSELGQALVRDLHEGFASRQGRRADLAKTLALVIGVTNHRDAVRVAPCSFAADDARAVAAALTSTPGAALPPQSVFGCFEAGATLAGVEQALEEVAGRLRPGDQLLVHFSGYGARDADGAPQLVLQDEDGLGGGRLNLQAFLARLAKLPAKVLVTLDCEFDGRGRSLGTPRTDPPPLVAPESVVVLQATRSGEDLLAPTELGASLFAHHLARGLRGAADRDRDGAVSAAELFALVRQRAVAEAAFFGRTQTPVAHQLNRPFALSIDAGPVSK